jgi:hypothetical protein
MASTSKSKDNAIYTQVGEERFELTGAELELYLADRAAEQLLEAEYEAKKQARANAITKLGQASGLTEEEINSILGL